MEYHSECRAGEILKVFRGTDSDGALIYSIYGTSRDGNEEEIFRAHVVLEKIM